MKNPDELSSAVEVAVATKGRRKRKSYRIALAEEIFLQAQRNLGDFRYGDHNG